MSQWIELSKHSKGNRELLGGKSYGVVKLLSNNLKTPKSYALTTDFFRTFSESTNFLELRESLLKSFSDFSLTEEELRSVCQEKIQACHFIKFSSKQEGFLREKYTFMSSVSKRFCLRSSANYEDGELASFAGVFNSYFEINTADDFLKAVKDIFISVLKYEVNVYSIKNNLNPLKLTMGILFQEYIACKKYGVLFSANMVSNNFDELVLSWTDKEGELLMSGEVSGESLTISKDNELEVPAKFKELIHNSLALESVMQHPVDLEWGLLRDESIVYFQVRSVTGINKAQMSNIVWSRALAEERYPQPVSPLGWSILRGVFKENIKTLNKRFGLIANSPDDVAITINHYVFANDQFFSLKNMKFNIISQLRYIPNLFWVIINFIFILPFVMIKKTAFNVKDLFFFCFFRFFLFVHAKEILNDWDKRLIPILNEIDAISLIELKDYDLGDLLKYHQNLEKIAFKYMEPDLAIYIVKMACEWMVGRFGSRVVPSIPKELFVAKLTAGLLKNRTLEMAIVMDELTESFKGFDLKDESSLDKLNSQQKEVLEKFLKLNGHLTVNWDFRVPTWSENKKDLLGMLQGILKATHQKDIESKVDDNNNKYQQDLDELKEKVPNEWTKNFLDELLNYLREFMRIDEEHHFYCSRFFGAMRTLFLTIGDRLVVEGVIKEAKDVFFFNNEELLELIKDKDFFSRRFLVSHRENSFNKSFNAKPADEFFKGKEVFKETIKIDDSSYQGVAASPGRASGKVRVLKSLEDCHKVQLGDIIVTQTPNPVFVPLYSIAAGIISNTGSTLSHGLVAAREYDIPAVIGIPNISFILTDGQEVSIDGNHGTVTLID
jgi:phosphoenolpyruvate synthase/pyruvate phosphate dikinase